MRLILSDPKRAKSIEKFDKENNHYAPFFGSEKARKEYDKNANGLSQSLSLYIMRWMMMPE